MSTLHLLNLVVHVAAGTVGLVIGFTLLARRKGTRRHRAWGRRFGAATLVVGLSAAVGSVFFRFLPLFAVLNVVVIYQLVSGWRVIYTREAGPAPIDALWTATGVLASVALIPVLMARPHDVPPTILYSTFAALGLLLAYDAARWAFPRRWHRAVWPYEHVYKLVCALFAMLSALVGNVVRFAQPWSQLLPSVLGMIVIVGFFIRMPRRTSRGRAG